MSDRACDGERVQQTSLSRPQNNTHHKIRVVYDGRYLPPTATLVCRHGSAFRHRLQVSESVCSQGRHHRKGRKSCGRRLDSQSYAAFIKSSTNDCEQNCQAESTYSPSSMRRSLTVADTRLRQRGHRLETTSDRFLSSLPTATSSAFRMVFPSPASLERMMGEATRRGSLTPWHERASG